MRKLSLFQIILFIVFGVVIIIAIFLITRSGPSSGTVKVELTMWGTVPKNAFSGIFTDVQDTTEIKINYFQKPDDSYETELLNTLASGSGPDIWEMPHDLVLKHRDKIFLLPFESFSERQFKNTFVEGTEVYLRDEGTIGMPFYLDPLVLYWNRDLFTNAGIAEPPKDWNEFMQYAEKLTLVDSSGNILQSGVALGESSNVLHAKEIISLLVLQTGNPILNSKTLRIELDRLQPGSALKPAEIALSFFIEFSNPRKVSYSWNKAMSQSDQAFIEGRLAMYFGFASEYEKLKEKNPHLNFDVATVPQIKGGAKKTTYAKMKAFVISSASRKAEASWLAMVGLTSGKNIGKLSEKLLLPPVRRDLLSKRPQSSVLAVFYESALPARTWLEPDSEKVSEIFGNMIKFIKSGEKKISEAVKDASRQLQALVK